MDEIDENLESIEGGLTLHEAWEKTAGQSGFHAILEVKSKIYSGMFHRGRYNYESEIIESIFAQGVAGADWWREIEEKVVKARVWKVKWTGP
jgi:hypothetical protein